MKRMTDDDPTVRGQELGAALQELREAAGFTLAEAASIINSSPSKLSRMESGKRRALIVDVSALLGFYRVRGTRRDELMSLAEKVDQRGWWQRYKEEFQERQHTLILLEAKANMITNFEGMHVPGLLQTGEYTRALMIESEMVPEDQIEQRMITRLRRHSILMRERPPQLLALIDELALHRIIGSTQVLRRQLEHLVEIAAKSHIDIRVIPNKRAHAGKDGAFALLHRNQYRPVVFVENLTSSLFLEEPEDIKEHQSAVRLLLRAALDEGQSVEFIASLAKRLDDEETVG
jgi:transcriptional regulator with XRE-family HTH domain